MLISELIATLQRALETTGDRRVVGVWEGQVVEVEAAYIYLEGDALGFDVDKYRLTEETNLAGLPAGLLPSQVPK